ncbi:MULTISPECIES: glycosyl transferase family 2 [unclassified Pseudodesulfovibrio]|uniref:glycosyl transferase family 2 n=1 Tax=unclassified Pseudodesulfovibrio TaxID=2661612 RepID=UPI000FEBC466|nr:MULTISPECIES: glycosyl transferase family 2 [unclassified Pseudodesulfovibrio]MCJ2163116.1 glycosyl transferase family 2 [Pseudodesulfovibrio sp. S3-i]RWU07108.1 glycosyl transferase family 2 [Pseudodesulfovibrio sp. S3]
MNTRLIREYTAAVLDFDFKDSTVSPPPPESTDDIAAFTDRTLRIMEKSHTQTLVLFGLGNGDHALALKAGLPESARLLVCETEPADARNFRAKHPSWNDASSRAAIITDSSLWAQLYLLSITGVSQEMTTMVLNPSIPEHKRKQYQALQRLFVNAKPHQAINSSYLSHVGVQAPDLSVGVILSPDEPNLDQFFAQFPDWVKEVVVVWDSETVPDQEYTCAVPVLNFAHPLEDFASQRNRMLDECSGQWVLYLDGDEMFSEDIWGLLTACMLVKRLEACYFPRMTFYPDESRCKVGYGLWPDLQLRLFRNRESVRFTRPVHERLTGIEGRTALILDAPILHYSRLRKSPETLAAKLKRFDAAGSDAVSHVLSADYPNIERTLMPEASFLMGSLQMLLLEENPA